jgi:N-acetylmuramoyl-L-alanine amidase
MADFAKRFTITPQYLTKPSRRRSGLAMSPGVRFLVAHDTGNAGSTARQNVAYYESSRDKLSASAHLFVDDQAILECIPALTGPPEKAWHVRYDSAADDQLFGFNANDAAIGVEYCFGGTIDADRAYARYVWVMAYACHTFGLDPARAIVGHFFLDPKRRTDPMTGLAHSRRTYEQLLRDVVTEHHAGLGQPVPPAAAAPAVPAAGTVRTTVRLNLREAPSTTAPIHETIPKGTVLQYQATAQGEPVNGNPLWLDDGNRHYFWSGGVTAVP